MPQPPCDVLGAAVFEGAEDNELAAADGGGVDANEGKEHDMTEAATALPLQINVCNAGTGVGEGGGTDIPAAEGNGAAIKVTVLVGVMAAGLHRLLSSPRPDIPSA